MPVSCCAVNCTNRFSKGSGVGFFQFPVDPRKKELWIRAISRVDVSGRKWEPSVHDRICGVHFVSGRPSKDESAIDYVPTIFRDAKKRGNARKSDPAREERAAKRSRNKAIDDEVQDAASVLMDLSWHTEPNIEAKAFVDCGIQVSDSIWEENGRLRDEVATLKATVCDLKRQLQDRENSNSKLQLIQDNDKKTKFYTGLPSFAVFMALFTFLKPKIESMSMWTGKSDANPVRDECNRGRKRKLDLEEEMLAVFMRLRLGLLLEDIADRFEIGLSTASKQFTTWIKVMAVELKFLFPWPAKGLILQKTPSQFKKYPNTRVIIDCTELFIQRPSSLQSQVLTFSNYKHHNTFKVLVGISPGGVVTFVSKLWGGRVSDKEITQKCGILELLEPGDNVMADKGFDIKDVLSPLGVHLNIPPFLSQKQQLSSKQVMETRRIAELRIHVERAIGRIKSFHILQGVIPLTLADIASDVFLVCALITNFGTPVVE